MSQFWKPGTERPQGRVVDDEEGGLLFLFGSHHSSSAKHGYASIEKQRQRLPVFKYRTAILYLVETHATTIIVGETGSGKTTQIPQYLKEAGWATGGRLIACTQPRRLAVQAVASRVAEEMGVKLGEEVGYTIRFEDVTKPSCLDSDEWSGSVVYFRFVAGQDVTVLKFLTDGVLLREMMDDPLLTKYSVIMVDEAHERSISTDILLGLLKKIQRRRPELRLIISSATIEAKSMSDFFQMRKKRRETENKDHGPQVEPAILSVEGRGFNVQINYAEEPVQDYVQAAVSTTLLIHERESAGDVLVFLTGQDDIDAAVQLLTDQVQTTGKHSSAHGSFSMALCCYTGIFSSDMQRDPATPMLYTEEYFLNHMPNAGIPEIQRSNMVSCVIQLKALGIDNILGFDWPASPSAEAMIRALEVLYSLGILDDDAKLTSPTGFQVAEIPLDKENDTIRCQNEFQLDPMVSKMIIASSQLGCSEEIITIAAVLSVQVNLFALVIAISIWISGRGIQKESDEAKLRFAAAEGDHVTFLNVYKGFHQSGKSSQWCHKNYVNYHAMRKVLEVREQLKRIAKRIGLVLKSCESDMQLVRKAVIAGFFANACHLEAYSHDGMYKTLRGSQEVYIHPSSVLFRVNPKWVIYHSLVSTDRQYMRNVLTIDPSCLMDAAPHFYKLQQSNHLLF
ncbi:pre-mRNA-splicing factor ATP-dependent RNA helicase [Vigna angularis]|uniref:RNA helicase n=1 Tax=Phaseolus angularis TaxID=3914 RepID=A0A8T0K8P9_PHAAN|nr:pre-mRNA-splicing factor ATP-dependent RNA helicase [Vigna angularis]